MKVTKARIALGALLVAASAALALPAASVQAYVPQTGVLTQLGSDPCLKGRGNCIIYPKATQLPSGRLVAAFEKSTVNPVSGSAAGQTVPVYKSDDNGDTWQPLAEVKAPAFLSADPQYAKYTSNWTNPFLYVMPQDVGDLKKGTLLLSTVVSGDDEYYKERKAADPNWTPSNDGDRRDMAIALYSSTDQGATWTFHNIVTTGGWQGGSAGAIGTFSAANTGQQVDPVWEPYLMVTQGKLVAYYSDENDFLSYDPATGSPVVDPANDTAADSRGQILAHRTWDGTGAAWGSAVVDVAGLVEDRGNGKTEIGGGRPGMTNVVPTTDGKWMLTFEYFGGGAGVRFKMVDDPLKFYTDSAPGGQEISRGDGQQGALPFEAGSRGLSWGGSPVTIALPDGRLVYNASESGDVWVNKSGRSDGVWTQYQTPLGGGYSRNLTYVATTGRVEILQGVWGGASAGSVIRYSDIDLGNSAGAYYQLVNRKTGQVMGTGNRTNDARFNNWTPDIKLEAPGSVSNADTQLWHMVTKANGTVTFLNKSGGREATVWGGNATPGTAMGQWFDDSATGRWTAVKNAEGYYTFRSVTNTDVYLTGATAGSAVTVQNAAPDGSQEWKLVEKDAPVLDTTAPVLTVTTSPAIPQGTNGWFTTSVTATATDDSGAAPTVQLSRDGGTSYAPYAAPVRLTDGTHALKFQAADAAGNTATADQPIKIDTVVPLSTGTADAAGRTATITGTDAAPGSGVNRIEYQIDGGPWATTVGDRAVVSVGSVATTIGYRSVDGAGNVSSTGSVTVPAAVDPAPKAATQITSTDQPSAAGWYSQNVVVGITAPTGNTAQYRLDNGPWRTASGSFTVSTNGAHVVDTRLLRNAVVVNGSADSFPVKIDKIVPTASATKTPTSGLGTPRNPVTVSFGGADSLSGLATVEYRINQGAWTTIAEGGSITFATVGDHLVSYRSTDAAGNSAATRTTTVSIKPNVATSIKSSASTVKPGGFVTFTVAGFRRFDTITVTNGATTLGTAFTDVNGSAKLTVTIPAGTATGSATITGTGTGASAQVGVTVKN